MKNWIHRFGKFYSRVIINLIGIFLFVGMLSVLFGEYGWMPNKEINAIAQFVYRYALPIMIAYASGNQMKRLNEHENLDELHAGGAIAVMATAGLLQANDTVGVLGAMILGPVCGWLWKFLLEPALRRVNSEIEMLLRNILVAIAGILMTIFAYFGFAPFLAEIDAALMDGIRFLLVHHSIFLLSLVIEPLKVFFLNNSIHHGILLPLGMQQVKQTGESILFLLETNPGPGFGVLLAAYIYKREKRKEYAASIFAQFIGGIHEVYFPEVLSNIWLIFAVILGGIAGNLCFNLLNVGTASAVSPGSIVTIFLVCGRENIAGVLLGVAMSAAISFVAAIYIFRFQGNHPLETASGKMCVKEDKEANAVLGENKRMIKRIGFICDAGVGSSSMGAALLRRKLAEKKITGIEVAAYAMDQLPEDLDLAVCQKNFKELLLSQQEDLNIYTMESLLDQEALNQLFEKLEDEK